MECLIDLIGEYVLSNNFSPLHYQSKRIELNFEVEGLKVGSFVVIHLQRMGETGSQIKE